MLNAKEEQDRPHLNLILFLN